MAVNVIKTGPGTITLGTDGEQDFSAQVTSIVLTPEVDEEDDVKTLSGDTVPGEDTESFVLSGTLYQDLNSSGIVAYSWENKGEVVEFEFTPNSDAGATITGEVKVRALAIGGDVDEQATSDFEWPCVGEPTPEWPTDGGGTTTASTTRTATKKTARKQATSQEQAPAGDG